MRLPELPVQSASKEVPRKPTESGRLGIIEQIPNLRPGKAHHRVPGARASVVQVGVKFLYSICSIDSQFEFYVKKIVKSCFRFFL